LPIVTTLSTSANDDPIITLIWSDHAPTPPTPQDRRCYKFTASSEDELSLAGPCELRLTQRPINSALLC